MGREVCDWWFGLALVGDDWEELLVGL